MAFLRRKLWHGLITTSPRRFMSSGPLLVSPSQAKDLAKTHRHVALLDASWFMPNSPRNAYEEFLSKRIPGAQYLDIDKVASPHELNLKHMMPTGRVFADACESFGIGPSTHVILYDTPGIFSSPRALFMFRSFGHLGSSVLNGGLPAWIANGYPVESGPPAQKNKAIYQTPDFDNQYIRSYEEVVLNSTFDPSKAEKVELLLDARARGRYLGSDPEPRAGLPSGHIPNSLSLPFNLFLRKQTSQDGDEYTTFLTPQELKQALFDAVGVEFGNLIVRGDVSVITSCGSGMTAAVLWLGLKLLGSDRVALYDESWTGYAMRPASKIKKGLSA